MRTKPHIKWIGTFWLAQFVKKQGFVNVVSSAGGKTPQQAYDNLCNYLKGVYTS